MILHHNCEKCGHPDYFHASQDCSYGACRFQLTQDRMTAPVLSTTWGLDGRPVLTITPPGTRFPEQGQGHKTCGCDACVAEFERLAGEVPA